MAIYIVMILAAADHLFEYEEAHEENLTLSKQLQEFQADRALVVGREKDLNVKVESADAIRNSIDNTDSRIGELELQLQKMKGYYSRVSCDGLIFVKRNGNDGSSVEGNSS
ncbi:PREDICTED: E3 ubiquitin-ligase BRE1 2 [Prunus dulcis]|uniref:PREDICTED: E3 ubiquitin-ligase BRE1 2 n=1 Tax=Prunus dulcis TaxID=3755 RepID=A0A5E4E432_PRUDU|nr:PREDICTED: E3 ubiquitin-ligase BRE1 2 [Prunus dulcis]